MKQKPEILLIAKELGLREDLLTPTGEGLKEELKKICLDINRVGKKLNEHIEEDLEVSRSIIQNKEDIEVVKSRLNALEKEMKDNISQRTVKKLWGYVQGSWRFVKPILYLAGVGMIYFIAKSLGVNMNI